MRLQTRLALLFGGVVTAAAVLMGTLSYGAIADRLRSSVDASLLEQSTPLALELARGRPAAQVVGQEPDGPGERGDDDRHERGGLVLPTQVVLPTGSVVASSSTDVVLPVSTDDVAMAAAADPALAFRDAVVDGTPYRMVTQTQGGSQGAVQVGRDVTENAEVLAALAWLLGLIGLAVAALAALAGWLLARRSAARLVTLTDAAEQVAATGQLDLRVPTQGSDEIGRLGAAFDAMLLRLAQSRDDQQRLVQDAGHELRTPLTSLRTNVHLLGRFEALDPRQRTRVIADLDGETRELAHLVDEVVQLAGTIPADAPREPVLLVGPAQAAVQRAQRRTGRDVRLTADDSTALAQPGLLERAIWNLVENACKFSPPDEPVEVVVERGAVLVRDRGPGIDADDLPHVFDRFYRATGARSLPGSGLGLAIVHDIVTTHGGTVRATNRPDGGAEVGFQLPLAPEAASDPNSGHADPASSM